MRRVLLSAGEWGDAGGSFGSRMEQRMGGGLYERRWWVLRRGWGSGWGDEVAREIRAKSGEGAAEVV